MYAVFDSIMYVYDMLYAVCCVYRKKNSMSV